MAELPELTFERADTLSSIAWEQLQTSRRFKQVRMEQIKESEDLYAGIVPKQLKNPFNECLPFMGGFVDTLLSKIDEAPNIEFNHTTGADFKKATKTTAAFSQERFSTAPTSLWSLKDRWAKKNAIFSGRGIYKYFAESDPVYKSHFNIVSHYNFHCEPNGGGHLENHLFCGEEGIYKTKAELQNGAKDNFYDPEQVKKLTEGGSNQTQYKENTDQEANVSGKFESRGQDIQSHAYVGETTYKMVEWYLTSEGIRYQISFDEASLIWVRVKFLREVFKPQDNGEALYPYPTFATHEDDIVFWSKAPTDDARPVGKAINKFFNQELYSREKRNHGPRGYDPEMVPDPALLDDSRPDALIPIDTKGRKSISSAIFEFKQGELNGTIDLISFMDSYTGQKTGVSPSTQGVSEKDKKVGIFFGELQQIQDRLGLLNKSYREAWAQLGLRFLNGLEEHLDEPMAIKIMGAKGVEWDELTREDLKVGSNFDINITGGREEEEKSFVEGEKKSKALAGVITVNPRWKDREVLRNAGYTDEEIQEAFDLTNPATRELESEAMAAIEDILNNKEPKINRGANVAFIQKIIDFAKDHEINQDKFDDLIEYAMRHRDIAIGNEEINAEEIINQSRQQQLNPTAPQGGGGSSPLPPNPSIPTPAAAKESIEIT